MPSAFLSRLKIQPAVMLVNKDLATSCLSNNCSVSLTTLFPCAISIYAYVAFDSFPASGTSDSIRLLS